MATDESIVKDTKFIQEPREWPRWPVLPLKRRNQAFHLGDYCGFLIAGEQPPFRVYLGTIFALKSARTLEEAVAGFPTKDYPTVEELTRDWTVD